MDSNKQEQSPLYQDIWFRSSQLHLSFEGQAAAEPALPCSPTVI